MAKARRKYKENERSIREKIEKSSTTMEKGGEIRMDDEESKDEKERGGKEASKIERIDGS